MRTRLTAFLLAFSFVFSPVAASAEMLPPPPPEQEFPEGLSSCFDYYTFGSIPVSLEGGTDTVAAGTDMVLAGKVRNDNSYPVSGLKIYAKLLQIDTEEKTVDGPDVVDDFLVSDTVAFGEEYPSKGFTLLPDEEKNFTLSYSLPAALKDGIYRVALYVIANDRFNMTGLSFTDDVIGTNYGFTVVGGGDGTLRFERSSFTVGGEKHHFVAFPTSMRDTGATRVEGVVTNDASAALSGMLMWTLYRWDQRRDAQMIETRTIPVSVAAGGSLPVTFDVNDERYTVYQLVGRLVTDRGTSIINVRMKQPGANEPRINFQGITEKDGALTAFACVHNTGDAKMLEDTKVVLSVSSSGYLGREFAKKTYFGSVPGQIAALSMPVSIFMPEKSILITTTLERGGKVVDSVTSKYSCQDLNVCSPITFEWALVILTLLIVLGGGFLLFRKRRMIGGGTNTV